MLESEKKLQAGIKEFLTSQNHLETYEHCLSVGNYAYQLGERFSVNHHQARVAGYLHDISAVYPNQQRIEEAKKRGIELYQEELALPMIIHQKISKAMAYNEFNVNDPAILSAIECHTTLKANCSPLDLVVFVADKIMWDQEGTPPYLFGLMTALERSLEEAAYYYIQYLLTHDIKVRHPWLMAAYKQLEDERNR